MRIASFNSPENEKIFCSLDDPIDLQNEVLSRGFPLASHGRIDWDEVPEKEIYGVGDDSEAADAIAKIIRDRNLNGETMVVWSDARVRPIRIDADMIWNCAVQICAEDWDCWIIPAAGSWIIEKYHEGEVCFAPAPGAR